ncbi:hypothetical protein [Spirosoma migulaei]
MNSFDKNVVYYSGLWYSTFLPFDNKKNSIYDNKRLEYDMRLLTLFFDIIYIPRSHFLTFYEIGRDHYDFVKSYLTNNDFRYLSNNNIILSSSLPSLDNYSDTERVVERIKNNKWSPYINTNFIDTIKNLDSVKINSKVESQNNIDKFEDYISGKIDINEKVGSILSEIKKKSVYGDIPFLHEKFIEEVKKSNELSISDKEDIWRETNSIYINSSGLDLGDRKVIYNNRIEYNYAIKDKNNILRELYSPNFISSLFVEELGANYLDKFLKGDIGNVMRFRDLDVWKGFKSEIFKMLEEISMFEYKNIIAPTDEKKILEYKKYIIKEKDKYGILGSIPNLVIDLSKSLGDPVTGNVVGGLKNVAVNLIIKIYSNYQLSRMMENYKPFWRELKNILKNH